MNPIFDVESDLAPGLWRFPTDRSRCSIYRVPACLRDVKPTAYTPQMVILGPLHHHLKLKALNSQEFLGYVNMEKHKRNYVREFSKRLDGDATIEEFKRIIRDNEDEIRESYSESTTWINSEDFVNMILYDSVFILEFILRLSSRNKTWKETEDQLIDIFCVSNTIMRDLTLLENQLPYFILERLFNPIIPTVCPGRTLREVIIDYVGGRIEYDTEFSHLTDLFRRVRVKTIQRGRCVGNFNILQHLANACKLDTGGVKFKVVGEHTSINVNFNKGCLEIPRFVVDGHGETILRNIMAFEQCHYPFKTHVCNYITFLDYLIDTEKDVDLLVEKGIIWDRSGHHALVAKTVNELCSGISVFSSYYSDIASDVQAYYNKPSTKRRAFLRRVYFSNIWTGTATVAATLLLLMTLIGTVASVIQAVKLFV